MLVIDTDRVLVSLRTLAQFGAQGAGVNRPALSTADLQARQWLAAEMESAGLAATIDAVGNVVGRANAPRALLLGSHADSVPTGGWLDGALGVVYAIEAARALNNHYPDAAIGFDVAAFADEEGRYLSCLGSKWFCGELAAAELSSLSFEGQDFAAVALQSGLPQAMGAQLDRQRYIGYFEAHIEQGPRLDSAAQDLGIVTGIAGMRRYRITFRGQADHAGTTPMSARRDAGMAAFDFAVLLRERFRQITAPEAVWNFGAITFHPGVANVVPKEAVLVLETRDLAVEVLDTMHSHLHQLVAEVDGRGGVQVHSEQTGSLPPASMDTGLCALLASSSAGYTGKIMHMHSGAIHDAMVLARHVPSAMLFVPSIGGRSHVALENTSEHHLRLGAEVFANAAFNMIMDGDHGD